MSLTFPRDKKRINPKDWEVDRGKESTNCTLQESYQTMMGNPELPRSMLACQVINVRITLITTHIIGRMANEYPRYLIVPRIRDPPGLSA